MEAPKLGLVLGPVSHTSRTGKGRSAFGFAFQTALRATVQPGGDLQARPWLAARGLTTPPLPCPSLLTPVTLG